MSVANPWMLGSPHPVDVPFRGWIPRLAVLRDHFVRRSLTGVDGRRRLSCRLAALSRDGGRCGEDHRARWENPHRESTADSRGHHGLPPVTCSCRAVVGTFPARTLTTADSGPMLALSSIARLTSVKESDEGEGSQR